MKRILYLPLLPLCLLLIQAVCFARPGKAQTPDRNYTLSRTYQSSGGGTPVTDISYLDGFGREIQNISVDAVPGGGGDLVRPVRYGVQGRAEQAYLPYSRPGNNGAYVNDPFGTGNWSVYGEAEKAYAFGATAYDNSPLDRVVKQTGPGAAWHVQGRGVATSYGSNAGNTVILWRLDDSGIPLREGYYPAHSLSCTRVTDEDGNAAESYTDGSGKTLLSVRMNGDERLETYFLYDPFGQLCYVFPPSASRLFTASGVPPEVLDLHCYRYLYDNWGRQVEKRLPGCAPVFVVYDFKNRPVLSQDGNQRDRGAWGYTLYDGLNRPVEIGETVLGDSRASLGAAAGASGNYTPSGVLTPMQYLVYDNYGQTAVLTRHGFLAENGFSGDYHRNVSGLLTGSKTRIPGTGDWVTNTLYYDGHCRVVQSVSDNRQGGVNRISTAYDFPGNVAGVRETCGKGDGTQDVSETVNTYDARGRLLSSVTTLNGSASGIVSYGYDGLGRQVSKTYGSGSAAFTENLSYNIRGWLTGKDSPAFGLRLRYDAPQSPSTVARYNGNVSEWEWRQGGNSSEMYGIAYDGANRFTASSHYVRSGQSWQPLASSYDEKGATYDANGNLLTLERTSAGALSNRSYAYSGNRLATFTKDGVSGSYSYDVNGNMVNDSRKNLNFGYNSLNLLDCVNEGTTRAATYTWLADGNKLSVRDGSGVNGFDYEGSFVYKRDASGVSLDGVAFGGGRIVRDGAGSFSANYFLTDHLGSVRAVVDGGTGEVRERSDYYPFGSRHGRVDYTVSDNRYRYNGKELQTTGNLGYLDYGARMYDPDLGRWFGVDPLSEKYYGLSSYNYCANNPIVMVDPKGMDIYRYDKRSGDFYLMEKTDDDFDQVGKFRYDRKTKEYTLKRNKNNEAKILMDDIEKGILTDGINFMMNDNMIFVGGAGQATLDGVESFILRLSDMVGKEIAGAYFSRGKTGFITHISMGRYVDNEYTLSKSKGHTLWNKLYPDSRLEDNIVGFLHTHPSSQSISVSDRTQPSQKDKESRDATLKLMPNLQFYILTHPVNYGGKFPYKIPYTTWQ